MKFIQKGPEPVEFTSWKAEGDPDWNPGWSDFANPQKQVVKDALLSEQGGICCYCGIRIESGNSHIEHLRPRHPSNEEELVNEELVYENLLASCNAKENCGDEKGNLTIPITPLDPDCGSRFGYGSYGEMNPLNTKDTAAIETLHRLGLGNKLLKEHRRAAIEGAGVFDSFISTQELKSSNYMQKDSEGNFPAFCFAIAFVISQL